MKSDKLIVSVYIKRSTYPAEWKWKFVDKNNAKNTSSCMQICAHCIRSGTMKSEARILITISLLKVLFPKQTQRYSFIWANLSRYAIIFHRRFLCIAHVFKSGDKNVLTLLLRVIDNFNLNEHSVARIFSARFQTCTRSALDTTFAFEMMKFLGSVETIAFQSSNEGGLGNIEAYFTKFTMKFESFSKMETLLLFQLLKPILKLCKSDMIKAEHCSAMKLFFLSTQAQKMFIFY